MAHLGLFGSSSPLGPLSPGRGTKLPPRGDAMRKITGGRDPPTLGCSFFAYSWKLLAYSGAFLLTVDNFGFFTYNWSFFTYSFSFFTYSWSFFAYSGKVCLISALRDCKQRSLAVSKEAPTVSKNFPPPTLKTPVTGDQDRGRGQISQRVDGRKSSELSGPLNLHFQKILTVGSQANFRGEFPLRSV